MTFQEALRAVYAVPGLMAVPANDPAPISAGITFSENDHPCWVWNTGAEAKIPAPYLLFGDWALVKAR